MKKLLTKADFDALECNTPNCDHNQCVWFLQALCCMDEGLEVRYDKVLGHLIVSCHRCGDEVVRIQPAG
jgi:hypothetical protein